MNIREARVIARRWAELRCGEGAPYGVATTRFAMSSLLAELDRLGSQPERSEIPPEVKRLIFAVESWNTARVELPESAHGDFINGVVGGLAAVQSIGLTQHPTVPPAVRPGGTP